MSFICLFLISFLLINQFLNVCVYVQALGLGQYKHLFDDDDDDDDDDGDSDDDDDDMNRDELFF